jgi:seryl-tRNA synthetase
MLDIRFVREKKDIVMNALNMRGEDTGLLDTLLTIETERKVQLSRVEELRQQRNKLSEEIGKLKKEKKDASTLLTSRSEPLVQYPRFPSSP